MSRDKTRNSPSPSEVMEAFRAGRKRGPLHPRERLLLVLLGLAVSGVTWLSGHPPSAAFFAALASLAAFFVALMPRPIVEGMDEIEWSSHWRIKRLAQFPVFWLGLVLCLFVWLQYLNPSVQAFWDPEAELWIREPLEHRSGWPVGIVAPLGEDTTGRALLAWTAAWLFACAVWVGISRRRGLLGLFWIIGLNGMAVAVVGVIQFFLKTSKVVWVFEPESSRVSSVFGRPEASAAFQILIFGLCIGLAFHYFFEARRHLLKSDPSGLFLAGAVAVAAMAVLSGLAFGTRVLAMILAVFLGFLAFILIWKNVKGLRRSAGIVVCSAFSAVFAWYGGAMLTAAARGTQPIDSNPAGASGEVRGNLWTAARELSSERPWTGWGAGSFRFQISGREQPVPGFEEAVIYHPTARNDLLQMAAELGRFGTLLALGCFLALVWRLFTPRTLANPLQVFLCLGILGVVAIGWRETVLTAPAVLLHFSGLLCAASLLANMEKPGKFRPPPSPLAREPTAWEKRGMRSIG